MILTILLVGALVACDKAPEITDDLLDGKVVYDSSLLYPERYLVSYAITNPTVDQLKLPVIITSHGYSGSTFEWKEYREWLSGREDVLLSQVLLGGHGRTYEDFKASHWEDWQYSIKQEYERLLALGFKDINLVGSSTSCALMLQMVASGYFNDKIPPKNIFLIDPIVIPSSKILSLIGILGPVLGYVDSGNTPEEIPYWYSYRPEETLQELQEIINVVRSDLEDGFLLPKGTNLKVYKSKQDPTADPVSAVLIYKGLKTADSKNITVEMIDSKIHVYTRLSLREKVSSSDVLNQEKTFNEITGLVLQ